MNKAMNKHWYTNGIVQVQKTECPEGFWPGRLPVSEETRKKQSQNTGWKNITQEQKDIRNSKISATKQNKTEEEKQQYSEKLSKARKGKGLGIEPWNKGAKGLQKAWNKGISPSEETRAKIKATKQNWTAEYKAYVEAKRMASRIYGNPWNKGQKMLEEQKAKISETLLNKTPEEKQAIMNKQYETKRQNNTFVTSEGEENFYIKLLNLFPANGIIRQYKESRYPFKCDFYIKSLDIFIELNFTWTHGFKPFEGTEQDLLMLEYWKKRAAKSNFYKEAIETWTQRDVLKFKTAKENNLNYLTYYSEADTKNLEEDLKKFIKST